MLKSRGGRGPPNSSLEEDRCDVIKGKTGKNTTHFPSPFLLGGDLWKVPKDEAGCLGEVLLVWPGWDPSQMAFLSLLLPAQETAETGSVGRALPKGFQTDG